MVLGFVTDTFMLFWGLFWHVWYLVPFVISISFMIKMYMCSLTTDSDSYTYNIEYRNGTKVAIQSFVEAVGFFTGLVNSLLGMVNMLKVLVMNRLGVTRKAVRSGGLNPVAFASMMMQTMTAKSEEPKAVEASKGQRSPSLRKAIRPPHNPIHNNGGNEGIRNRGSDPESKED